MKRCPFKTNLNKMYTSTFRDSDFHFFFASEKNDDGTYTACRGGVLPTYLWAVYDTLNMNRQYSDQQKDKVIDLVFDGVLQTTLSDELYEEYSSIKKNKYTSKEELLNISKDFYKRCMQYYSGNIFRLGLQKRKNIILDVYYKVMDLHMPSFIYVK